MSDYRTKPRAGPLDSQLLTRLIEPYGLQYPTAEVFTTSSNIRLENTEWARVSQMRIPYSPYYDTNFIMKLFRPDGHSRAMEEQVAVEAASMQHAAEALQRNNNICRAARVYHVWPQKGLIAMELIRARDFRASAQGWWSKERMIKFVRHMAVIRLAILTQAENELGDPQHTTDGGRVGPCCAGAWWDLERYRFRNQINRGPFPNRHEMILASLRRELLVFRRMRGIGRSAPGNSYYDINELVEYLEMTIENIDQVPRPTSPEFFSLNHYNISGGSNITVRGSKVAALINWGSASYDPLSVCVSDLTRATDFNPRVWRQHSGPDGQNFHVLPYRLNLDPMDELFVNATNSGAERKPFPDWQVIDNNGGPLNEEDFCGHKYPEDISSDDDESITDSVEMHCDSDIDAEEEFVPRTTQKRRTGPDYLPSIPGRQSLAREWYDEPVYALMKEFIHHQRGAGLGPDGEWGKLPEEFSRPLADWEDPLFMNIAKADFIGTRDQIIDSNMVHMVVDHATKVPAPTHNVPNPTQNSPNRTPDVPNHIQNGQHGTHKSPRRQRRVPALISTMQSGDMVGADIAPESPVSSSSSAYLAKNRLQRGQQPLPPTTTLKTGRNQDPIPMSMLPRVREPWQEKQWEEIDHPAVEAELEDDDVLANGVRGSIIAKVMEQLWVRQDSGAGAP
ncbi:hypothetical protein HOY82DRAFT_637501 [Tuber indicum]|nr:hypothetical protein HOY82DRAFT_637501 [Tuber indicum]